MFTLDFTNIPDNGIRKFAYKEEAIAYGKKTGFEFRIYKDGELIVSWSVFGGLKHFV